MNTMIYLDYAAATPMDERVFTAMQPYFSERFYNPSATYLPAVIVRKDLGEARARVAHWLGARPNEIVFTAGGTEANNLAIRGVMEQFPGKKVVISSIEHESVLCPAHQHYYAEAPVTKDGIIDLDKLTQLIDDDTVLVSVMYANNEMGAVQPIRQLGHAVQAIRKSRHAAGNNLPLYLHTDAAQAAAYLDLHTARLGVDMLTLNAGKMYGPKQCGILFVHHDVRLQPQVLGGGQERGARSGTENVAGAIGLSTALDLVQNRRHSETERLQKLQHLFFELVAEKIPQAIINGSRKQRLPNNIHLTIPGKDNERLLFELEQQGILCAAGSACSASNEEPSHVLRAMGLSDQEAQASLRFSMGAQTDETAVRAATNALAELV